MSLKQVKQQKQKLNQINRNEGYLIKDNREKKTKKRLVLKKKFIVMFLILFLGLGMFSSIKIILWSLDAQKTEKQIDEINKSVVVEEVID